MEYECKVVAEDDFSGWENESFTEVRDAGEEAYETFDDKLFGFNKKLSGILIKSGYVVDAIRFIYNDDESLGLYGGSGGSSKIFMLQEGEHITQVSWLTGMWEDYPLEVTAYISFRTNRGREFSGGRKDKCRQIKSYSSSAGTGQCIHSFAGRYGKYFLGIDKVHGRSIGLLKFDDTFYVQERKRVTEIRLNSGWVVDGIQFVYDGDKEIHFHGGHGGARTALKLQEDEYITSINGKTGKYMFHEGETLCSITIKTNKGRSLEGGTEEGCSELKEFFYGTEKGEQIFALCGSYNDYMRNIDVGMYALIGSDEAEGCKTAEAYEEEAKTDAAAENAQGGSLEEAIKRCLKSMDIHRMVDNTLNATEKGSVCRSRIESQRAAIEATLITEKYVNTEQYVFRAPTIRGEQDYIRKEKKILSKAQARSSQYKPVISMDKQNTEQYEYSTVLRALAIKSSDMPPSQFVSHALDLNTASAFLMGNSCVYAYKIIPNSPLLGLFEEGVTGKGEEQFQILGGTEITELYKFDSIDGKYAHRMWQRYDFKSKQWIRVGQAGIPVNKEYEKFKEHSGGEL